MTPAASNFVLPAKEVEIGGIDRALRALWETSDHLTRASLMNFAVYSEEPGSLMRNNALMTEILNEQACRAILVSVEAGAATPGRAWVTAHCHLNKAGEKSVCSEQIAFLLSRESAHMTPNIVFSHLESDLPLVLWWQGAFSENFVPELYSRIERLIFDSADWSDPAGQFSLLRRALERTRDRIILCDLNWARTLSFRVALSAAFDDPASLDSLPEMRRILVEHRPGHALGALLLAGWIANRLGWRHQAGSGGKGIHRFQGAGPDSPTCEVRLIESTSAEAVSSLVLESAGCGVKIAKVSGGGHLRRTVSRAGACEGGGEEQIIPGGDGDSLARLITRVIMRKSPHTQYARSLSLLERLLAETR